MKVQWQVTSTVNSPMPVFEIEANSIKFKMIGVSILIGPKKSHSLTSCGGRRTEISPSACCTHRTNTSNSGIRSKAQG